MRAESAKNRVESQFVQKGDIGRIYGGVQIEGNVTIKEALDLGGLNWEVGIKNVCIADKIRTPIPGYKSVYRKDTGAPLGIVGERYTPLQNAEAFDWLEALVGDTNAATVETAGVLNGGKMVFVCLDLGGFEVLPGDEVRKHLLFINSHDGSSSIFGQIMPARISCQNMLNYHMAAMRGNTDGKFRIRHTKNARIRMDEAVQVMGFAQKSFEAVEKSFSLFSTVTINEDEQNAIILDALKIKPGDYKKFNAGTLKTPRTPQWVEQIKQIKEVQQYAPGHEFGDGTVWSTFNAINGYFDHMRTTRGAKDNADNETVSRVLGHAAKMKMSAFEACDNFVRRVKA
jgi:phage/plasmid-like protein (TIGR03299 family)